MKAYLYTLNTLADWEISYITAELSSGRFLDKSKPSIQLIKIGNTTDPIKTMGGISITPEESIDNIKFNEGDLLILPGADTWGEEENKKIINLIPELLDKNIIVAAICGATVALAQNKLLDNKKHTSNGKGFLKIFAPKYLGENNYLEQPAVVDSNLITASAFAPLEFSYEVFKKMNVMKPETLEAWYQLYKTKDAKFFHTLMESLKNEIHS
jgi:putative intracellular protease/amidase